MFNKITDDIKHLKKIYRAKDDHFIKVDFSFYKKWKCIIILLVMLNKNYTSCEIARKKYKNLNNFIVIGLKWNGKIVNRSVAGFAKKFVNNNRDAKCLYCECQLTIDNCTCEHLVCISKRGTNSKVNLVACCLDCNRERGNQDFKRYIRKKNPKYKKSKYIFF